MSEVEPRGGIAERFEAILREHQDREAMADACELIAARGLEPLLESWRRMYVKVPPDLNAHLQAHAEFCVITDLIRVLKLMAAEAGSTRRTTEEMVAGAVADLAQEIEASVPDEADTE